MPSIALRLPFSPVSLAASIVAALAIVYLALIAVVIGYAATTVEFAQSVRNDEAQVATLEAQYLNQVTYITSADYHALGYAKPTSQTFVRSAAVTALR